jgi:hypothetical protein
MNTNNSFANYVGVDTNFLPESVSLSTTNDPSASFVILAANVACGAFRKPARRGPVCPQSLKKWF